MKIPLPQVGLSTNTTPVIGPGQAPGVSGDVVGRQLQGLGGAMLQAGTAAMGIASELRIEHDTTITKEAYTRLADYATEVLENPKTGYLTTKEGQSAVGAERAKALGSIEKRWRELEQELGTPVAKGMFREQAQKAFVDIKRKVYGHEATERRVWALGQTRAMQRQAARDAISAGIRGDTPVDVAEGAELAGADEDRAYGRQNPATAIGATGKNVAPGGPQGPAQGPYEAEVQRLIGAGYSESAAREMVGISTERTGQEYPTWKRHLDTAVEQVEEESRMLGESAELRGERVLQMRTEVHEGIVRGMLSQGRTKEARDWLEKVPEKHLAVGSRLGLQQALQEADRADTSYRLANEIVDQLAIDDSTIEVGGSRLEVRTWAEELKAGATAGETGAGVNQRGQVDTTTMLARGAAELRRRFEAGEIDARTRDMTMARLKEDHALLVSQWNAEAQDTLREAEQWFDRNPHVRDPDSPSFPQDLRSRLNKFGLVDSARKIGAARGVRVTDPIVYRQMYEDYESGAFDGMLPSQLFNRYYAHLGTAEWNEAQSYLALANKDTYKPPPDDDFYSVNDQVLEQALLGEVITGRTPDGKPKPADDEEALMLVEYKKEVQKRWNVERDATGASKDKDLPTAEKIRIANEVAFDKRWAKRYDIHPDFLFGLGDVMDSDVSYWAWQKNIPKDDEETLFVKTKFGTEVQLDKIPRGARVLIQDSYRLLFVPSKQRESVAKELKRLGFGTPDADRSEIESMWKRLGLVSRNPPAPFLAEKWEQLRHQQGSHYYKWGERK